LAVLWTWPLAAHLSTRVPHDLGDPLLNTWILWWNAHAVPFTATWWSPPILSPMRGALALSEHLAGLGVIATPMQLLGGSPLAAYNTCLLLSYALSGWFAYLLVARLSGSNAAGIVAGVAFATTPYRAGQLAHLQVLTSQWMPAMFLALHGYAETRRRRWLAAFALAWLLQATSNGYFLLFLPVLITLWLAWFVEWRRGPRPGLAIAATWTLASLLLLPALLEYRQVHSTLGLGRQAGEITRFSATAASFAHIPPMLRFWSPSAVPTQEDYLFPGVSGLLLILLAMAWTMWARWRSSAEAATSAPTRPRALAFYVIAAMMMWACAFGPGAETGITSWWRPYRLLALLPGFDGLRVPARFAMPASFCVSVAAGLAIARLRPLAGRAFPAVVTIALAGLFVDGAMDPMPLAPPPPRALLPPGDAVVLELPADDARVNVAAMYRAMEHGRTLINGYSGYSPPHFTILSLALRRGDASPIAALAAGRPLAIVVNDQYDEGGDVERLVEGLPGIERFGVSSAGTVFQLAAQPRLVQPPEGPAIVFQARDAGGQQLVLDLAEPQIVRTVAFNLRWHYQELGERLRIERSDDGRVWQEAWLGWTGALAMLGAIADPQRVPIRIALPDIRTRYLRVYPAPYWMARELSVSGP
ncbi:MAG: hypothetical protein ABI211_06285, partial [Vicinamibacterales bacterium]